MMFMDELVKLLVFENQEYPAIGHTQTVFFQT